MKVSAKKQSLVKRCSTPGLPKQKPALKSKKRSNTNPVPSPNSSFSEDSKKKLFKRSPREPSPLKFNLSIYLKIEKNIWSLVQSISDSESFTKTKNELWELIKKNNVWEVENLFKELKTKKLIRKALIVELCGIMISPDLYRFNDSMSNLKNLSLFIHQNYIEFLFTLQALPLPQSPALKKMKSIVQAKRMTTISDKKISLSQNTEILTGLIKDICKHFRQCSKQTALSSSIFSIVKSLNKLTYPTVRDVLAQALALSEPILIKPLEPFLPVVPSGTFTLVLDLDETLIHFVQKGEEGAIYVRPGCEEFLKAMSEWYELVVFTAGLQDVIHK